MIETAVRQTIKSLNDARQHFGLEQAADNSFFEEWADELPELSDREIAKLDQLRDRLDYHLDSGKVDEGIVNVLVVSSLLEMAGLYDAPFLVRSEVPVVIESQVQQENLRGRIDFLVIHNQLWRGIIESKDTTFDVNMGIPQTLAYMAGVDNKLPTYGLVTNGVSFVFLKLVRGEVNQFDFSDVIARRSRTNSLYQVLQILKALTLKIKR
ncbi:MAG: type I restriction endonuclease [Cyanobacteria bacterium P01_C01_bin.89]